jgi:hypothetical protein
VVRLGLGVQWLVQLAALVALGLGAWRGRLAASVGCEGLFTLGAAVPKISVSCLRATCCALPIG